MAISFVKSVGTAASSSNSITSLALTVATGGVPIGDCVLVRFAAWNFHTGNANPTCADSRGNTYVRDWNQSNTSDGCNAIFRCVLTTALLAGDTITVSFTATNQDYSLAADQFTGIDAASPLYQVASIGTAGTSTTPSNTVTPGGTPPAITLVYGFMALANEGAATITADADSVGGDTWHTLTQSVSAADANQIGGHGAYKIPTAGNTGTAQTWNPTLSTSLFWLQNLALYRGATVFAGSASAALTLGASATGTKRGVGAKSSVLTLGASTAGAKRTASTPAPHLTLGLLVLGLVPSPAPAAPGPATPVGANALYRLCLANTATGQVAMDLPLAGVPNWSRQINAPGTLTNVPVALSPALDATTRQMLTEPWRWTVIYAYRGTILQAGLLVGASVDDSQSPPVAQLTTKTLWDFLAAKRLVFNNAGYIATGNVADPSVDVVFSATSPDLANRNLSWGSVARRLVELTCTAANPDLRFALPVLLPTPVAGTTTVTYTAADGATVGQRLNDITQQNNPPEIEFSPEWVDSTRTYLRWRMRIGDGARLGQPGYPWAWDYMRACQSLPYALDGTNMVWRVNAKGQDTRGSGGGGTLVWADSSAITPPNAVLGWPWLQIADNTHSTETSVAVVQGYAQQQVLTNETPMITATMTIRSDGLAASGQPTGSPSLDLLAIGDTAILGVTGGRHPLLADGQYGLRVLGLANGLDPFTATCTVQILGMVAT